MIPLTDPHFIVLLTALRTSQATPAQQQHAAAHLEYLTRQLEKAHHILRMAERQQQVTLKAQQQPGNS
jgi:hypothetical protein